MKKVIEFILNNADVLGTILIALLTRLIEKPTTEKKAKIQVLEQLVDESTKPDEEGKSRSVFEVITDILHTLRKK